jgi:predicted ATPase
MAKLNTSLVALTGSGGTGKTTTCKAFEKLYPDLSTFMPSITREFYAKKGIANEAEFKKLSPSSALDFQFELIIAFLNETVDNLKVCKTRILICDRSIFDHIAYIYVSMLRSGEKVYRLAEIKKLVLSYEELNPLIFYVPYPTPYKVSTEDGFRDVDPIKDYAIDAIICKCTLRSDIRTIVISGYTVEQRVSFIADTIYYL